LGVKASGNLLIDCDEVNDRATGAGAASGCRDDIGETTDAVLMYVLPGLIAYWSASHANRASSTPDGHSGLSLIWIAPGAAIAQFGAEPSPAI
jgi:hypothetical protein